MLRLLREGEELGGCGQSRRERINVLTLLQWIGFLFSFDLLLRVADGLGCLLTSATRSICESFEQGLQLLWTFWEHYHRLALLLLAGGVHELELEVVKRLASALIDDQLACIALFHDTIAQTQSLVRFLVRAFLEKVNQISICVQHEE